PLALPGEPPRHDPEQGPGVRDIDLGRAWSTQPDPLDLHEEAAVVVGLALTHLSPHGGDGAQARTRVGRIEKSGDPRWTLSHRTDQGRPVGDRLVGWRTQLAVQWSCGPEPGHSARETSWPRSRMSCSPRSA